MKVFLQDVRAFSIPLVRPINLSGRTLVHRTGLFIRLADASGRCGVGEVAPLPGFHQESLPECREALSRCMGETPAIEIGCDAPATEAINLKRALEGLAPFEAIPSLHFGLCMASINLLAGRAGVAPSRLMKRDCAEVIPVNGLVTGDPAGWAADVQAQVGRGCNLVKIKVGRNVDAERGALMALQRQHGRRLRLILDGNRSLAMDEATHLLAGLDADGIVYCEELLHDPAGLRRLEERTGIAMALDETLFEGDGSAALEQEWESVVVLKVDRLRGSVLRAAALAEAARQRGSVAVVSSAYNTPLALSFLVQLAAALECPHVGIDTWRWFPEALSGGLHFVPGGIGVADTWGGTLAAFESVLE